MLFNSLEFLIFLPIVFLVYWSLKRYRRLQNTFVIAASYVFYGWWDWKFLILIIFTSLCSYASGLSIARFDAKSKRSTAKWISAANIIVNIAILGIFKYYNFFTSSFQTFLQQFGVETDFVTIKLVLPVGISFYTFQALSYSIDVYRRKIEATKDITAFLAFISFFPQLVAGPIERATNLLPQFLKTRNFDYNQAVDGSRQVLWGFFKKMVIADNCAVAVNDIFGNYSEYSSLVLICGGILFAFQIYGDFSGYSDIAIGISKIFGINLKRNFNVPYFSRNVAEFWKRWHISLNTWFVDYIYIPLGGSRHGKAKTIRNTMTIFALSGLWHGANWTFIVWGLYHGLLFVPLIMLGSTKKYNNEAATLKQLPMMAITFALVVIGWIIFRADNIEFGFDYLQKIFSPSDWSMNFVELRQCYKPLFWIAMMLMVEWLTRKCGHNFQITDTNLANTSRIASIVVKHRFVRWSIYVVLIMTILVFGGQQTEFIYFQF